MLVRLGRWSGSAGSCRVRDLVGGGAVNPFDNVSNWAIAGAFLGGAFGGFAGLLCGCGFILCCPIDSFRGGIIGAIIGGVIHGLISGRRVDIIDGGCAGCGNLGCSGAGVGFVIIIIIAVIFS